MKDIDRERDRAEIARLNDDFCHELDRGGVDAFVALFAIDALYTHGARISRGHAQIREFYLNRARNGPRTSRHVTSGLRIRFESETRASGLSVCTTFSAPGTPPIESTIPAIVADFEDIYVLIDGQWRFQQRNIIPLFRSPAPAKP